MENLNEGKKKKMSYMAELAEIDKQSAIVAMEAKINKLEYTTGLSMFFGQAQESFKIWFKIRPVIDNYITSKIKKKLKRK